MHRAAGVGASTICRVLLQARADANALNRNRQTAYDVALKCSGEAGPVVRVAEPISGGDEMGKPFGRGDRQWQVRAN